MEGSLINNNSQKFNSPSMGFSLESKALSTTLDEAKNFGTNSTSAEIRIPVELAEADTTFWEEDLDGTLSVKTNPSTLSKE